MAGPFSLLRLAAVGNCSSRAIIGTSVKYRGAWRWKRMDATLDAALVLVNREWQAKVSSVGCKLFEFFFFLLFCFFSPNRKYCLRAEWYRRDIKKIGEFFFYFWKRINSDRFFGDISRVSWTIYRFGKREVREEIFGEGLILMGNLINRRISRGWILRRLMGK